MSTTITSSPFSSLSEQHRSESVSSASIIPSLVIDAPKTTQYSSLAVESPPPPLPSTPCPPLSDDGPSDNKSNNNNNNATLTSITNGKQPQQPSPNAIDNSSVTQSATISGQPASQPPPPQRADTLADLNPSANIGQKRTFRRNPHISTLRDRSLPVNHSFNTSVNVASVPADSANVCGGVINTSVGGSGSGIGSGPGPSIGIGSGGSTLGSGFHFARLEPIGEISTPNHAAVAPPAFRESISVGGAQSAQMQNTCQGGSGTVSGTGTGTVMASGAFNRAESRAASFFMDSFQSQYGGHPSLGYRDSNQDSLPSQQTSQLHSPVGYQASMQSQQSLNTVFGGGAATYGGLQTSSSALPHQPFSSAAIIHVPVRVSVPALTKNVSLPERDSPRSHGHSFGNEKGSGSGNASGTGTGSHTPRAAPKSDTSQRFDTPSPSEPKQFQQHQVLPGQHARHTSVVVAPVSTAFSSTSRLEVGAMGRLGTVSGSPRIAPERERGPSVGAGGFARCGYVRRSSSANRINEKDPFAKIGLQLLKVTGGMGFHQLRDVRALSNVSKDSLGGVGGGGCGPAAAGSDRRLRLDSQSSNKKDSLSLRAPTTKQSGSNLTALSALSASTQMLVNPVAHLAAVDLKSAAFPRLPTKGDLQTPIATPKNTKTRSNSCKTRRRDSRRSNRSVPQREQSSDFRVLIDDADFYLPHPQVIPPSPTGSPLGGGVRAGRDGRQRCDTVPASVFDIDSSVCVTSPLLSCSVRGLDESAKLLSPTGAGQPCAASSLTITTCVIPSLTNSLLIHFVYYRAQICTRISNHIPYLKFNINGFGIR